MYNNRPVILFDGVCNLCNGAVRFILKWEKTPAFSFTALQADAAEKILNNFRNEIIEDSIIYVEDGKLFQKSTAVLKIAAHLRFFWIFKYFRFLPVRFRDRVYDYIAHNRYRWFGRQNQCMIPTPEIKSRFL